MLTIEKRLKNTLNYTINNFLSFLLKSRDEFSKMLCENYTKKEKYEFIYNCALNTIDEYISEDKCTLSLDLSTLSIINLFKENFRLEMFEKIKANNKYVPKSTKNLICEFSCIKENLSNVEKNNIMRKLASTMS